MARTPVDDITTVVKDAAFVSVGLGVLAFQKIQVRRNELRKAFEGQTGATPGLLDQVVSQLGEQAKVVEERLGALRSR